MSYLKKFTRGERRLAQKELDLYDEVIKYNHSSSEDIKLQNLYKECFAPHVSDFYDESLNELVIANQDDRIIARDNLTQVFLKKYYCVPNVEHNSKYGKETLAENQIKKFILRITSNPIVIHNYQDKIDLGSNRVSYLLGDVGIGKSTFISRIIMDINENPISDNEGYSMMLLRYDFEKRHRDGEKLKDIDNSFWAGIYELITLKTHSDYPLCDLGSVEINPILPNGEYHNNLIFHIKLLIHHLAKNKIRLFIIFDNIDRYHFHYTKYSYFENGDENQLESVKSNISRLVNMFDKTDLAKSGLCILFVCRKYLYDYMLSYVDDVFPNISYSTVYNIGDISVDKVITSRYDLFAKSISISNGSIKNITSKEFKEYLSRLKNLAVVEETGKNLKLGKQHVLESINKLGHNGFRSLVKFFSTLSLSYKDSDAIHRLLVQQPHLLLLLYICNNHKKYTQEQKHFPNIFLCDCLVIPNKEFPNAHKPHKHSYWIKYLILKYLCVREECGDYCTGTDIIDYFSMGGKYEEHLVRLALGSLCTSSEFSCVRIEYRGESALKDCRLTLTDRGKYLVSSDTELFPGESIEFCFNFHYLQMIIDDKLLALPLPWFNKICLTGTDYSYLYMTNNDYGVVSARIIKTKIEAVIYFIRILQASLEYEMSDKNSLYENLKHDKILPDFFDINREILIVADKLLKSSNRDSDIESIHKIYNDTCSNSDFDDFFKNLSVEEELVKK